jgi:hypothetical protein
MSNLYRAVSAELFRVDSRLTLVTSDRRDGATAIDHVSAAALRLCAAERSLDAHVDDVARRLTGDPHLARSTIEALLSMGLLQEVAHTAHRLGPEAAGPVPIRTLAIVTADRPDMLRRCVESYLEYLDDADPAGSVRLLVVDGSRRADAAAANEHSIAQGRTRTNRRLDYAGARARTALGQRLVASGVPRGVADWLLGEGVKAPTPGATRNHVLLETVGEPVLSVDDDTLAQVWAGKASSEGLALAGHSDVRDTHFFQSRQEAIHAASASPRGDLLEAHERLLGQTLGALVAKARPMLETTHLCWHVLPMLEGARPDWVVRATWSAVAGDSAVHCPYPVLFVTGPTRERLAADPATLQLALTTREVVRQVRRPTVADEPWLMTYCAAFDNRAELPPFSPLGANEDGLFGAMLRMCEPGAFVGQVPVGVIHDSARGSVYESRTIRSAWDLRINDLVHWLGAPLASTILETDVRARTRLIGEHLAACARLTPAGWKSLVTRTVTDARRRVLASADTVLADGFSYPEAWRQAVRRYQQAVLDAVASPQAMIPVEFAGAPSGAEASMAAAYVRAFGEALAWWPTIREVVRTP